MTVYEPKLPPNYREQPKEAYLHFEGADLFFDVVEKETLRHSAEPTEHYVEEGADITDHIRNSPDTVQLEIFVSNTPLRDANKMYDGNVAGLELKVPKFERPIPMTPGAAMNAGLDAIASAINGPPEPWVASVLQFPQGFNQVSFIFNSLIDWKERGVIGQVITPHRTYPSVCITSVEMSRDATTGEGAPITIEFKQIRLVEAKYVTVPVPSEPRGKTMKNKGRQPTSFVRDPQQKKDILTSIGFNLFRR